MFEVLTEAYARCWQRGAFPPPGVLQAELEAGGWPPESAARALRWLYRLRQRAMTPRTPSLGSGTARVLAAPEQRRLGPEGWRLIHRLSEHGAIDAVAREQVLEAVMDTPAQALGEDEVRLIVCWVLWSQGIDRLNDDTTDLRPARAVGLVH